MLKLKITPPNEPSLDASLRSQEEIKFFEMSPTNKNIHIYERNIEKLEIKNEKLESQVETLYVENRKYSAKLQSLDKVEYIQASLESKGILSALFVAIGGGMISSASFIPAVPTYITIAVGWVLLGSGMLYLLSYKLTNRLHKKRKESN